MAFALTINGASRAGSCDRHALGRQSVYQRTNLYLSRKLGGSTIWSATLDYVSDAAYAVHEANRPSRTPGVIIFLHCIFELRGVSKWNSMIICR